MTQRLKIRVPRSRSVAPTAVKVVTAIVLVIAVQTGAVLAITALLPDWQERGQFGEILGAVNTLLSGLALAAVAYALVLQSRELALQREELAAAREEVRRSVEAQPALADSTRRQFELTERVRIESEQRSQKMTTSRLKSKGELPNENEWRCEVEMMGERIWDAWTKSESEDGDVRFGPSGQLDPGDAAFLFFQGNLGDLLPFTLHYRDSDGRSRATEYISNPWGGTIELIGELDSEKEV